MKLRRLISALIVFTLVMTCAMSAVSAADYSTTTTKYNATTGEITVVTTATVTGDPMVSYIIYGDDADTATSETVKEENIKYIDQQTAENGTVTFTVTDTIAKLGGRSILMGSSGEKLNAKEDGEDNVVKPANVPLFVSIDSKPIIDEESKTLTFLVSQSVSTYTTGINVYAYAKGAGENAEPAHEFLGLDNLSKNDTYYAISLVDDTAAAESYISDDYDYVAVPYYIDGNERIEMVEDVENGIHYAVNGKITVKVPEDAE